MEKSVVKISSHALSDYQRCPKRFYYSTQRKIERATYNKSFDRGTLFGRMLESYYNDVRDKLWHPGKALELVEEHIEKSELSDADKQLLPRVFFQYLKHYRHESWKPKVTELPFSFVLYEDDKYLFVYEGTMDLIVEIPNVSKIAVIDHKTYSVWSEIYEYNNQALGYCYAMHTDMFLYNYIGFTETKKPEDNFRRLPKKFTKAQLDEWKDNTIYWFKRIADDAEYRKSLNCTTKYGVCEMSKLCETPGAATIESLIQLYYRPNEYGSWGKEKILESQKTSP